MSSIKKVLRSTNDNFGDRCVDIFRRPDGTYGFDTYRRDEGYWSASGGFAERVFSDEGSAEAAAVAAVGWYGEQRNT